jgi:AraC family transcriptional regulator
MGLPVHRYVVERRVERARQLLLRGDRSMGDIAIEAGFTHQSHMARCLRRVLGIGSADVAKSNVRGHSEALRMLISSEMINA